MAEMSRENAREIKEYMYDIETAVKRLLEYRERGESVYVNFNGHKLYSCDVTIDSAYLEIVGMTKEQDDAIRREYDLAKTPEEKEAIMEKWSKLSHQRDQENNMKREEAIELTGHIFVGGLDNNGVLKSGIEKAVEYLQECKKNGQNVYIVFNGHKLYSCDVTIDSAYLEIVGMTKEQDDAIRREYDLAKTPEEKKAIIEKWSKLSHQRDQENTPLTNRKVEEQEINGLFAKKEQLTAEISDIEQQLQALKAKEVELKKALGDKQSQLNGLEEK